MNRTKQLTNNVLLQYTILSLLITILIALVLIENILASTQKHSIAVHSKIYIDFIQSIPQNYPTIFDESNKNLDHKHQELNSKNAIVSDLEHFITDMLIFPELTEIYIYGKDRSLMFELNKNDFSLAEKHKDDIFDKVYNKETLHFVHSLDNITILHTFLPVIENDLVIGVVEIVDTDDSFTKFLDESKKDLLVKISISGFVFYIALFALFFKAYISQQKALIRLNKSQELTIHAMSLLAELRDNETGAHILRTQAYCKILSLELKKNSKFKKYLTKEYIEDLERSAPLHDIGKVGVPDHILLKPGKLTSEEFEIIKKHPSYGAEVLSRVAEKLDFRSYFEIGIQVILHHHENWDGSGYPSGLSASNIPLSARIMTVADVYDALRTERPYKKPFTHIESTKIILQDSGKKFDPELIIAFKNIEAQFEKISNN